jgi:hypothetical protein
LLAVAVAVALWENMQAASLKRRAILPLEPRHVVSLDVNLERLPTEAADPASDQAQRAAALDGALGRMSRPPPGPQHPGGQAWPETQPMVAAGLQVEQSSKCSTDHAADTPLA